MTLSTKTLHYLSKEMGPHEVAVHIVVPVLDRLIGWADDSWSFRQWREHPQNFWLEYMTFREVALERKKRLTIAQFLLERYTEEENESDLASMTFYIRQAETFERIMNIMMQLGYKEWTVTIDESIWPKWQCATRVMTSFTICRDKDQTACIGYCNEWAKSILLRQSTKARVGSLDFWKRTAAQFVASRWIRLVESTVKE